MATSAADTKTVIYKTLKYNETCDGVEEPDDARNHPRIKCEECDKGFVYVFPLDTSCGTMKQLQQWLNAELAVAFAKVEFETNQLVKYKRFYIETRLAYYAKTFDLMKFDGKNVF